MAILSISFVIVSILRFSAAISALNEISKSPGDESKVEKIFTPVVSMATAVNEVDERFLSVAIESAIVHRWRHFDTSNVRLQTLCRGLSPAFLRVGGTSADFLIFKPNGRSPRSNYEPRFEDSYQDEAFDGKHYDNFTMNAESWDTLNTFAYQSGWDLLFDLNVLLRKADSSWDSENATHLLEYSIHKNYSQHLHFELGNEPDAFKHSVNRSLSADQLGRDFLALRSLVKQDPRFARHFARSLLVGPDVTRPKKKSLKYLSQYLRSKFLQVVGQRVDRVTFHQYYCNGRNTSLQEFLDPHTLSQLPMQISRLRYSIRKFDNVTLWLGETSSCYGGGAPVLSESFVAGFLWADKLGVAAVSGIQVVIRQSLFSGHYSLIDNDYKPNPLPIEYEQGSVTLMILNLRNRTSTIDIEAKKHVYWLTAHGPKGLVSRLVDLNGKTLKMLDAHTLPEFQPQEVKSRTLSVPALSYGFVVLPEAAAPACLE
ncbi:hypothetical protein CAPTEDRAFT_216883 [Capitella teleta]|uniref:Heparanase n=1 Tax=Capitella teleta TaxID=283909 RepID=R7TGU6_CAPTE|nr:hypothetical protein CAPTEDRAFT_216883 [Capitella teleta]|eukprot:ELT92924.1 hypothetical protein CAPTEDRAFT_216883 [Capitella teleta]